MISYYIDLHDQIILTHNASTVGFYYNERYGEPLSTNIIFRDFIGQANRSMVTKFSHDNVFGFRKITNIKTAMKKLELWLDNLSSVDYILMLSEVYRP